MKLLIGILYTIENEFPQCIEAIEKQTYQNFDYFVIENLPNKEAHDTLYQRFMDGATEYDLFIKIDADMVLTRDTFFEEVVKKMSENPEVEHLAIAVHDFFTNRLIWGLNVYRNTVKWDNGNESIFVDRGLTRKLNRLADYQDLAPAAYHCPNPSDFQSFHFGLHKAIKVTQKNVSPYREGSGLSHWVNILNLKQHYQATNDKRLELALFGALYALLKKWNASHVNYSNSLTYRTFERISKRIAVHRMRLRFYLFISDKMNANMLLQIILWDKHMAKGRKNAFRSFRSAIQKNQLAHVAKRHAI